MNVDSSVNISNGHVNAVVSADNTSVSADVDVNNRNVQSDVQRRNSSVDAQAQVRSGNIHTEVNPHMSVVNDHAQLQNLGYDESGHTGFQRELIPDESITIDEEGHIHANGESYTAGQNINIDEDNVISAVDTTYTQGNGITIDQDNVISNDIYPLVPAQATPTNQLADKDFVNSSIATSTATFRGTYNIVTDLHMSTSATHQQVATALGTTISVADNNDYSFVEIPTDDLTPTETLQVDRYKYNGSSWSFEYTLNNSGYTSAQWKAINSGITSGKVTQYDDYAASKQDTLIAGNNITIGADGKTISSDIPNATQQVYGKVLLGVAGGAATYESVDSKKPILYPTTPIDVRGTSMVVKSSVDGNGQLLTENGFVYSTIGTPTINDNKVICDLSVGLMQKELTGLTMNTQYHIRSYGENANGLVYGSELIQITSNIPTGYKIYEYIESNGSQYINTAYIPNINTQLDLDFEISNLSGRSILGCRVSSSSIFFAMWIMNGYYIRADYVNTTQNLTTDIPTNTRMHCGFSNNYAYYGQYNTNFSFSNMNSNQPCAIFSVRTGNNYDSNNAHGKIYRCTISENNILLHDFKPASRISDGKTGLYDFIDNIFRENLGNQEFVCGPEIN